MTSIHSTSTSSSSHALGKRHSSEMKLRFVVSSTKKNKFERQLEEEISFLQETTKNKNMKSHSTSTDSNSNSNSIHQSSSSLNQLKSTPPHPPSKIDLNPRNSNLNLRRTFSSNLNPKSTSIEPNNNSINNHNHNSKSSNSNPNEHSSPSVHPNPSSSVNSNPNPCIGPNGQTLLHYACQNHPSPECLQTLLDCLHPSTLLRPDNDGNLPIHMAMTNGASHDALWVLIRNAPHSVHIANRWGYRAWDWVWERCHYELITLARTTSSSSSSSSGGGDRDMDRDRDSARKGKLWKEKVWNTIDALIRAAAGEWEDGQVKVQNTHSKSASTTTTTRSSNTEAGSSTRTFSMNSGRTLLHMIADFDFDCPINLIQAILDEYPTMTNEKDAYGRVPIAHAAAKKECGNATMHSTNTNIRMGTGHNHSNHSSMHSHAHSAGSSTATTTTTTTTTNSSSNHQNNECTFSSIPFTSLIIRMLILANPMALMEEDHSGRIALHMAIDAGRGWKDIVRTMARSAPDSMQKMDPITNLYPVMMLSSRGEQEQEGKGNSIIVAQEPTGVDDIYEAMSFCVQVCCNV